MPELVAGEPFRESILGGIRYVRKSSPLLGSMALDLFAVFFGGAIALLPVFATDVLHVGAAGLGLLRTAPSLGALLVMVVATRWPPSRHAGRVFLVSVAGFGVSMLVFGLSTSFVLSLAALVHEGVTDGSAWSSARPILRVPLTGSDPGPGRGGQLVFIVPRPSSAPSKAACRTPGRSGSVRRRGWGVPRSSSLGRRAFSCRPSRSSTSKLRAHTTGAARVGDRRQIGSGFRSDRAPDH